MVNVRPPPKLEALLASHGREQQPRSTAAMDAAGTAYADAARLRGNACLKGGDALGAYEAYSAGLARVPASWPGCVALRGNRAQACLKLGWDRAAVEDSFAALHGDRGYAKGWFRLAQALMAGGDAVAVDCAAHAAALTPRDPAAAQLFADAKRAAAEAYKPGPPVTIRIGVTPAPAEADGAASGSDDDDVDPSPECVAVELRTLTQTTGGTVWDAAVLLAHWLAENVDLADRRVLEVGAGCGCVGLACAALGARHVGLTDSDAGVVANLVSNAALNGFEHLVDAYDLDFCKPGAVRRADYDLVVGSECVYYESCGAVADLVRTAAPEPAGAPPGGLAAVFCMADSRVGLDALADAARAAGFRYERLPFPKHLARRARACNPEELPKRNTFAVHALYYT